VAPGGVAVRAMPGSRGSVSYGVIGSDSLMSTGHGLTPWK